MTIDHVELYVTDRDAAATWYQRVFGLNILEAYREWAKDGPLMMSSDGGNTMLALFEGPAQGTEDARGLRRLAFRVGAEEFIAFLESSAAWRDELLSLKNIQDHDKSISVYFTDPCGNPLEVTTYEHAAARSRLPS